MKNHNKEVSHCDKTKTKLAIIDQYLPNTYEMLVVELSELGSEYHKESEE